MAIQEKEDFINKVISRVINNAPVSEVLRVYSLSVQAAINELSDEDLLESVLKAGYTDLLEEHVSPEEFLKEDLELVKELEAEPETSVEPASV